MRLRIAILGQSPCGGCFAACCRQNGHAYAVLLQGDERRRFAPFAIDVRMQREDGSIVVERVLPYVDERCQFLADDNRCTIYEDRPDACRAFQCVSHYNREGIARHGRFLEQNPSVLRLLESL